jgi:hypothetical protein
MVDAMAYVVVNHRSILPNTRIQSSTCCPAETYEGAGQWADPPNFARHFGPGPRM